MRRCSILLLALTCAACAGDEEPAPTPPPTTTDPADPGAELHAGGDPGAGAEECKALLTLAGGIGCGLAKLWCSAATTLELGHTRIPCDIAVPFACGVLSAAEDAAAALCGP